MVSLVWFILFVRGKAFYFTSHHYFLLFLHKISNTWAGIKTMPLCKYEVTLKKCNWCETSRKIDRKSAHKRTERDHGDFSYI